MFHERLPLAERYAGWLAGAGIERGLIGPREVERVWDRHLLNCGVVAPEVPQGASVADVGTGAGLPGLVWAVARPDLQITLIEPLLRRTTFLEEVVADLELGDRVRVQRGRADAFHDVLSFDVVTSRAVAPLERLITWCLPLVDPAGQMLALKGSRAAEEVRESTETLQEWRTGDVEVLELGAGVLEEPTWAVRVRFADPSAGSGRRPSGSRTGARASTRARRHRRRR